jgi:GH25 family lysozyme M1 (1,4-beta-N-acetylmuramidase)
MTSATGIDVSSYQGTFSWDQHKDIGFAGIRATSWTGPASFTADADLRLNDAASWDAFSGKIPRIFYHEARAAASAPDAQALAVLRVAGHYLVAGDMLAVAMGDNGGNGSLSPGQVAAWNGEFAHHLRLLTERLHRVLLYCNPSWAQGGNCKGLGGWGLWLASYGVSDPVAPSPWGKHDWRIWQSSGTGLDRDVYNGDQSALLAWCGMPGFRR